MAIHELLYPLLTALDAVELKSDVELGATEQKFNLLVHREIQREYGLASEVILTMPILEGLDGVRKMSKSLGNYVGIPEPPAGMFGKLMSISDELMWRYYLLLTDITPTQIEELKKSVASGSAHPLKVKKDLARKIVADFYGSENAAQAQKDFESQFQESALPSDLTTVSHNFVPPRKVFQLLVDLKLCATNSEAQRKIKEGAVSISAARTDRPEWKRLNNPTEEFNASENPAVIFRVGRKLLRVNFRTEN